MAHPLVLQLRFTRSEFLRALAGVTDADARRRLLPMNCISWTVAHLAGQEQRCWLTRLQGITPYPELEELAGYGMPASTPPLDEMGAAWNAVTAASDPFLDTCTNEILLSPYPRSSGKPSEYSIGSVLHIVNYHYWAHLGEVMAIRQMLGHTELPEFVGDLHLQAPFQP